MSANKHTPGPWEAVGNLVRSPMVQPQGLSKGVQIAECRDAYFLSHTEESKANAHLIAAAPELLDALRAFLRAPSVGSAGPGAVTIAVQDFNLRAARAAIAKATGEPQ